MVVWHSSMKKNVPETSLQLSTYGDSYAITVEEVCSSFTRAVVV